MDAPALRTYEASARKLMLQNPSPDDQLAHGHPDEDPAPSAAPWMTQDQIPPLEHPHQEALDALEILTEELATALRVTSAGRAVVQHPWLLDLALAAIRAALSFWDRAHHKDASAS